MARGAVSRRVTGLLPRGESGGLRDTWEVGILEPFATSPEAGACGMYAGGRAWGWVRVGQARGAVGEEAPTGPCRESTCQQHRQPRENQDDANRTKTLDPLPSSAQHSGRRNEMERVERANTAPASGQTFELRTSSLLGGGGDMKQKWINMDWTRLAFF